MTSPSPPTLQTLPIPTLTPPRSIHLISNLLTPTECTSLISTHTNLIPSNVTPTTVRDREIFTDAALASLLWSRISTFFQEEMGKVVDEDGEGWTVRGLNETFRLCRYTQGGKFSAHTDGRRLESVNDQAFMTINIYLASLPLSHGGATRFLAPSHEVIASIQPVLGQALLFRDDLWHDGEELSGGVKYLLRTDVMYSRDEEFDFERLGEFEGVYGALGDERKGRKALAIAEGLEDAGRGEEAVVWYKKAFRLWPALGR
ncbi:hypothetical protein L207DRAFT_511830, partial [Hyaloscypha variabilis F]